MLFQTGNVLESEKERNLYSKVFAGYYFNELVAGYSERLSRFSDLLVTKNAPTFNGPVNRSFRLAPETTSVTFDFHAYLLDKKNDRGELADMLIADLANKSVVAVEVKFLSNWNFEKDVKAASKRFKSLLANRRISSFVHVLLLTQTKLDAVRRAAGRSGSNWAKLSQLSREKPKYPLVILTWEDIAKSCTGDQGEVVSEFLSRHIRLTRGAFRDQARSLLEAT